MSQPPSSPAPSISSHQSHKSRQENSGETESSVYETNSSSNETTKVIHWHPHDPHKARIKPPTRTDISNTGDSLPLMPVLTFAINKGHPIIAAWEHLRPEIHRVLHKAGIKWISISVFSRTQKPAPTNNDATLVIVAPRANWGPYWEQAIAQCHELTHIFVELRGNSGERVKIHADQEGESESLKSEYFEHHIKPRSGSSIGVYGLNWSTGTLGGFAEIQNSSGQTMVCAMTNHHVVRPTKCGESIQGPIAYDRELTEVGKAHGAVLPRNNWELKTAQPALGDHQKMLSWCKKRTDAYEGIFKRLEPMVLAEDPRGLERHAFFQSDFKANAAESMRVSEFNLDFGAVWATSGYKVSPRTGGALDWALIRVHQGRIGANRLDEARKILDMGGGDFLMGFKELPSLCKGRASLRWLEDKGVPVMQMGKSSGIRLCDVNRLRTDVQLPEHHGQQLSEIVILPRDGKEFPKGGDSGSWIFDELGCVRGMSWGGGAVENLGGFMTPIDEVFESIFEMTGCRVRVLGDTQWSP